jgi:hypothetical protein
VKGESQEIDPKDLPSRLDEDEGSMARNQEELIRDLAKLVPDGTQVQDPEDLDGLLSDFDGSSRPSLKVPILKPEQIKARTVPDPRSAPTRKPPAPPSPAQQKPLKK